MGQEVSDLAENRMAESLQQNGEGLTSKEPARSAAESTLLSDIVPEVSSTLPKNAARWSKDFVRIKHDGPRDVKSFVPRTSHSNSQGETTTELPYLLLEIDTPSGKAECLANTKKQWNATQSSGEGKLPAELKAACLYMFGHEVQPVERIKMKRREWQTFESELSKHIKDLPTPLEEYARVRNEAIHTRPRRSSHRDESGSPASRAMSETESDMEIRRPRMAFAGNDFSYMDRAAQETMNDSEYVKGVGIVPINRQYSTTSSTQLETIQETFALSPANYAYRDCDFPHCEVLTTGSIVESKSLPETASKNSQHFIVHWRGKSGQVIMITKNSVDILKFALEDIINCYYNAELKKIMLSVTNKEILITFADEGPNDWMIFKHCCYNLLEGRSGKHIAKESVEFFTQKAKSLILGPKKMATPPQFANRGGPGPQRKPSQGHSKFKQTILRRFSRPDGSLSKGQKPPGAGNLKLPKSGKKRSREDSSDTDSNVEKDSEQLRQSKSLQHQVILTSKTPEGLYYNRRYTSESEPPLPVSLYDRVVRVRTKESRDTGKRDSYDIIDGPWCIKKFDTADHIQGLDDSDDSDPPTTNSHKWERMLKTKVALNFPVASLANKWVEIGQLIPLVETQNMLSGEIFDSCLSVAQLPQFQVLKGKIHSKNRCEAAESESNGHEGVQDLAGREVDENDDTLYLAQVKKEQFIAVIEIASQSLDDGDSYEVEKLRGKRIRLYKPDSPDVKEFGLKTDDDDPWVRRIKNQAPSLTKDRIAVSEYLVHWAGWPNEDDTWSLGTNNIPAEFIQEFDLLTDPLRGVPVDQPIENLESLIFAGDLTAEKKRIKARPRKSGSTRRSGGRRSSGSKTKNAKNVPLVADDTNVDALAGDGEDEDLAKAIQASMEEIQTKRLFEEHQKELGVTNNLKSKTVDDENEDMEITMDDDGNSFECDLISGSREHPQAADTDKRILAEAVAPNKTLSVENEDFHPGMREEELGFVNKKRAHFQAYVADEEDEHASMDLSTRDNEVT